RGKIFSALVDSIIDRLADILELVGAELEAVSRIIFNASSPAPGLASGANGHAKRGRDVIATAPDYTALLERIGRNGELASKARESLVSLARMVAFYIEIIRAVSPAELDEHWRT